jgi:hypothetical protein
LQGEVLAGYFWELAGLDSQRIFFKKNKFADFLSTTQIVKIFKRYIEKERNISG